MAYYDALIAAWNSATQPPAGVTGSGLLAGDTTAQKCAKINGWTMAGPAKQMLVNSTVIYNLIVISEYTALSAANQTIVNNLLSMGLLDGSPGTNVRSRIVQIFPRFNESKEDFLRSPLPQVDMTGGWRFSGLPGADHCPPVASRRAATCPQARYRRGNGCLRFRGRGSPTRGTTGTAHGCIRQPW